MAKTSNRATSASASAPPQIKVERRVPQVAQRATASKTKSKSVPVASKRSVVGAPQSRGKTMTVRTTAYSCKENEKGGIYGNKNAIGTSLRYGAVRSAAADWSRFPVGTKFRISGQPQIYIIEDYGSALVGTNTIDIYKPTLGMMNDWGVRHIDIQVLEWGSLERSAEILKARTHVSHTRKMYHACNAKLSKIATRSGAAAAAADKRG